MNKLIAVVVGIFFVVFPFINYRYFLYSGTSTRSLALVGLVGILGLIYFIFLFRRGGRLSLPRSPVFWVLIAYGVLLFVAGWLGLSFHLSFWSVATRTTGLWYFINLGLFILLTWQAVGWKGAGQDRLILAVVLSSAVYSVLGWLGPEGLNVVFKNYPGDGFTFGNSSFAGMYLLGTFLLSIYYLARQPVRHWWHYLLPFLFLINPNFLNRAVWFGDFSQGFIGEAQASTFALVFSVALLLVAWVLSKIKQVKTRAVGSFGLLFVGVVLAITATVSLISPGGFLNDQYLRRATAVRPLTWEIAFQAIKERPWLGWGGDTFERVFELRYDNRLLQPEYGSEAWLDRAHNVTVDQLVDAGGIGLLAYVLTYLVLVASLVFIAVYSNSRTDRLLATILAVYFSAHVIELQTAFETSISYPLLALMLVLSFGVWARTSLQIGKKGELIVAGPAKQGVALVGLVFCAWSIVWGAIPFARAQIANGQLRTTGSSEKRLPLYADLLQSPIDQHSFLWRTSTDFQRGIAENPQVLADPRQFNSLKQELEVIEGAYRDYLENNPGHFRAYLSLADVLIYERLFEVDKLVETEMILDKALELVPQAPQPYWMKSVAYLYQGKFNLAREWANKGLALNPKIPDSQKMLQYIESSIKTFPDIDLVFFQRI